MKKERIEDLGILYEKIKEIVNNQVFEYCNSKHDYEYWLAQFDKDETLYDVHRSIRFIKDELEECIAIARGDDE